MRTIAFVGPSGTGKSHRSNAVASRFGADGIIDDGLLVSGTRILAGTSAKREKTRVASVKHALFLKKEQADEVRNAIEKNGLQCVMVLGTSDGMVEKIAGNLGLPPIEKIIRIEDVATQEEMQLAHDMRIHEGKHVIPVPTFEIKQDFSGYFLHPLHFLKELPRDKKVVTDVKSIVRPTFSYLGNYEISDNVLIAISTYEAQKFPEITKVHSVYVRKTNHGAHLDITVSVKYGCDIQKVCRKVQLAAAYSVEEYTSVNARRVHVYVKGIDR